MAGSNKPLEILERESMAKCPTCGRTVGDYAVICPNCGEDVVKVKAESEWASKTARNIVVFALLFALYLLYKHH